MEDNSKLGEQPSQGNARSTDKTARGKRADARNRKRAREEAPSAAAPSASQQRRKGAEQREENTDSSNRQGSEDSRWQPRNLCLLPGSLKNELLNWLDDYIRKENLTVSVPPSPNQAAESPMSGALGSKLSRH
eukprot:gb/GECG01011822.1/.p1 GENE.gb/GECG01011822.1/~~gb/GECG01011822.1/.p1  ORF type:complete len:133 (+),score=18.23 gb/GECG01011822.1/:1-399(+)